MPPKGRKRAYQMPDPLPEGEVLKDMGKNEWKLGPPLGSGGFGLIYRAAKNSSAKVGLDAPCAVKIEPRENGPLFTEYHFYLRAAQSDNVIAWQKKRKLAHLGVPKLLGSGIHQRKDIKTGKDIEYRFIVMPRFGEDIWKKYLACDRKFNPATVFALSLQILDSLEYIHENDYAHADIKSANLLLGLSPKDQNKVFLVDFGLVNRYRPGGTHKVYKEDPKKGHNGTPEFTSIDAHKGVPPSRRGDVQILGYVMLQWLCNKLPWEDKLDDLSYVMSTKVKYSIDITGLLKTCFKGSAYPAELKLFLEYAFKLGYDADPDYDMLRRLCRSTLKREGFKEGSPFDFALTTTAAKPNGVQRSPVKSSRASPQKQAEPRNRKAPSSARERSQSASGRKRTKDDVPGPSGAASTPASPPKKGAGKTATKKAPASSKQGKSPKTPISPKATKPAGRKVAAAETTKKPQRSSGKEAGVSTPSRKVRKRKPRPDEMTTSSTQTTPGLERRTGARR